MVKWSLSIHVRQSAPVAKSCRTLMVGDVMPQCSQGALCAALLLIASGLPGSELYKVWYIHVRTPKEPNNKAV